MDSSGDELIARCQKDTREVIISADQDKSLLKQCLSPLLAPFWDRLWSRMNKNPRYLDVIKDRTLTYIPLKPQKNLPSFLLVAGMDFLNRWKSSNDRSLLEKAANEPYCNFHALRELTSLLIAGLEQADPIQEIESVLDQIFHYGQLAVKYHRAAGYLLLTEIHIQLDDYFLGSNRDQNRSYAANELSYVYLKTAERLLEDCPNEIHNALDGQAVIQSVMQKLESTIAIHHPAKRQRLESQVDEFVEMDLAETDDLFETETGEFLTPPSSP